MKSFLKCVWHIVVLFFLWLDVFLIFGCMWTKTKFNINFEEVINTLTLSLKGASNTVAMEGFRFCLPYFIVFGIGLPILIFVVEYFISKKKPNSLRIYRTGILISVFLGLIGALAYINVSFQVLSYFGKKHSSSTLYEDYFVDPREVQIESKSEKKRNLIYVYLESMENTYADQENGGAQENNYMPELTKLAKDNVSFSNQDSMGGFVETNGTTWTMAALLSTSSGVPFSLPVRGNTGMDSQKLFASGLYTLGDFLKENGYHNIFLCGSDIAFAGRDKYYEQHGEYEIDDYYRAIEDEIIPSDHFVWWGMEDYHTFDYAKEKLLAVANNDEPFNFTMLTVDMHHTGGYICDRCGSNWDNELANVVSCTDSQVADFVEWCKEQDFYDNTTIIITGDHLRMDTVLMENLGDYGRTVYNCIINGTEDIDFEKTRNRIFTAQDIFPTTLAAMGYEIEGNRLGLGTNLFSEKQTLAEEIGFQNLNDMITLGSDYYTEHFAPELMQDLERFHYSDEECLDTIYFFGDHYNLSEYENSGFADRESSFSWNNGNEVSIKIPVDTTKKVLVSISIKQIYNAPQGYKVFCNGEEVLNGAAGLDERGLYDYLEFVAKPKDQILDIRIELPDAISPAELAGAGDTRKLALGFEDLKIYKYSRWK